MKNILFIGFAFGVISLTSCDKTYECMTENSIEKYSTGTYSESEIESLKASCEASDGEWRLIPRFY